MFQIIASHPTKIEAKPEPVKQPAKLSEQQKTEEMARLGEKRKRINSRPYCHMEKCQIMPVGHVILEHIQHVLSCDGKRYLIRKEIDEALKCKVVQAVVPQKMTCNMTPLSSKR